MSSRKQQNKPKAAQTMASFMTAVKSAIAKKSRPAKGNKPKPKGKGQHQRNKVGGTGRLGLSSTNSSTQSRRAQIIEEDEYIADVFGSVAFVATAYPVNIGQSGTFPWGYKIASLYEKYDFEFIEFYYRRQVSEFATNGQAGKVFLSADYDASDSPPGGKQQVEDTAPHIDGMPCSEQLVLRLDPKVIRKGDAKFVRPGLLPANTDIKTYDCANLYVSTAGNTNTTVIGELRVRYRCKLSVPVLETGVTTTGSAGAQMLISSAIAGEAAAATTVYNALFASTTNPIVLANGIGAVLASTGLITVNAGTYLLEYWNTGSDSAAALTAGTLEFNNVVTANTGTVLTSGAGTVVTGDVSGHNDWQNTISLVWPTALYGTSIAAQAALTYASGSALNHGNLRITQL
jgi:hypothetical protein